MVERVLLRKNGKGRTLKCEIYTGESLAPDCVIRKAKLNSIEGHYLVEECHSLGGGQGGWSSYSRYIGIAHSANELPEKISQCAQRYARGLAKKLKVKFIDESS